MSLHSTTDRFIEDIVKAAKESFARSPRRQPGEQLHVQVSGSDGHKLAEVFVHHNGQTYWTDRGTAAKLVEKGGVIDEELTAKNRDTLSRFKAKHANHAALGAGLGGLLLPGLGAPIGAALGADEGQGLSAAGSTLLGGLGGSAVGSAAGGGIGALLGLLANNPRAGAALGSAIGGGAGGIGGALYGANRGGEAPHKLGQACEAGIHSAAARFGVKEAFIGPLLGSVAGPMLARAGVGALARGVGGKALGGVAGKVLPRIGSGMGGMAFDAATSAAGSALGDRFQQPKAPGL